MPVTKAHTTYSSIHTKHSELRTPSQDEQKLKMSGCLVLSQTGETGRSWLKSIVSSCLMKNALNLLMGMVEWYRMSLRPLNVNLQCVNNLVGELYPIIAIV